MKLKEETGLASCYITCANKTDWQRETSKRSNTDEIIEHWTWKSREPNRKKLEITFQINLSVAIQVSCFDDLIDFFSQLITKVHHGPLEFFSTYKPVTIHVKHFKHFSYLCFCVCFFHPGVHQVEKFSKVNDAIVLEKKNVNLVQFKRTESDRPTSFHPTTAFLALSLLDLISNSPDCLKYNSC